jgi:PAS domain S-box-containing protein
LAQFNSLLQQGLTKALWLGCLLLSLGLGLSWFMAGVLSRPVIMLANRAGQVQTGEDSFEVNPTGIVELDNLASNLNHMLAHLEENRLVLEEEIDARIKAEEEQQQSQEHFRGLVESTTDCVWEIDAKGVYTYASPACEQLLGVSPQVVVGTTPFDYMDEHEAARVRALFGEIIQNHESITALENTNIHKDGELVVLETSGVPFFDYDGSLIGYAGI